MQLYNTGLQMEPDNDSAVVQEESYNLVGDSNVDDAAKLRAALDSKGPALASRAASVSPAKSLSEADRAASLEALDDLTYDEGDSNFWEKDQFKPVLDRIEHGL